MLSLPGSLSPMSQTFPILFVGGEIYVTYYTT